MTLSVYTVLIVFVLLVLSLAELITATSMFFTSTVKGNELQLICKLTQLMYDVSIIDENGIEQASCLIPSLFEPKCVSYLHNAQIYQNIKTNTTILTIWKGVNDGSFDGIWTCRHGRGKEEATTKVTVTDYSNAFEKNTKWTFIGLITTCLLLNTAIVIHSFIRCSGGCCSEIKPSFHDKRSKKVIIAIMWFICLILIALLSAIPIYLDYLGKSVPFPAQVFIADGFIIGVSCYIMSYISVRTDNEPEIKDKGEPIQPKEQRSNLTENSKNVTQPQTSEISSEKDNESDESDKCEHNRPEEPDPNLTENNDETLLFETSGHEMENNESTSKDSQSKIRDAHCTIM